jgi:DNA mismatch repair protein MSH4
MLKSFLRSILPIYDALDGAESSILAIIQQNCQPKCLRSALNHIEESINEDVTYQKSPLDLRNQRTYAIKVENLVIFVKFC